MVRGIFGVSTNGSNRLVLKTGEKSQKKLVFGVANEVKKSVGEIDLPAKVVLKFMEISGKNMVIKNRNDCEVFKMSCDIVYDDTECYLAYGL